MSTQITMEEFESTMSPASGGEKKRSRKPQQEKEEIISTQLLFSLWLSAEDDYMTRDGVIYKYLGTHWQAQDPLDVEKLAFRWLAENAQKKATDKIAISCVGSAVMHLPTLPGAIESKDAVKVSVKNGTINVEVEGTSLHDHNKEDYLTHSLGCIFDAQAKSAMWLDFLAAALPDQDVLNYIQEYVGYTLIGDARHHLAVWLVGNGGNGKGTFAEVVSALHSERGVVSLRIGLGGLSGFNLAPLIGASLVVVDETPSRIDEEGIKTIISGDPCSADRKYRDVVRFKPTAKWIIQGNSMPSLSDQTDGIWRRIAIVPFDHRPAHPTPLLAQSIIRHELSGVLSCNR